MIEEDHCVYMKRFEGNFVILSLYVDGILLPGTSVKDVKTIKDWLSLNFEMKDMGEAEYILGVKIKRDRSKRMLSMSQKTYIVKIVERFNMRDCKPMDTPVVKGHHLSTNMCPKEESEVQRMKRVSYLSVIESLMYTVLCARLDICFVIGFVSRFQSAKLKI